MVGVRVAGQVLFIAAGQTGAGVGGPDTWGRQAETRGPWVMLGAIAQLRVKGGSSGRADWEAGDPGERGVRGGHRRAESRSVRRAPVQFPVA